jgi:phenylacetate-CoA ligase
MELVPTGDGHEERPCLHLELLNLVDEMAVGQELRKRLVAHLQEVNRDFATASAEDESAADIQVRFHRPGDGPFAANSSRIKRVFALPAVIRT